MKKVQVYHFHNGTGGGVLSVIKNLLKYRISPFIDNHVIYVINPLVAPDFKLTELEGAVSQQVIRYVVEDNFYNTCAQLKKCLPDENAVIVAHDWIELGMASNLGLQNPVIHMVHGAYDYYYNLAVKHEAAVDHFVTVTKDIEVWIKKMVPHRKMDVTSCYFPVPVIPYKKEKSTDRFNIAFIGRLEEAKGFHLLAEVANLLQQNNKNVKWYIIGSASQIKVEGWAENTDVTFYGEIGNDTVHRLLQEMHILLLPSLVEGMPVSVIEAMKAGVVPLVNDIDGGIQEIVINGQTGYKIAGNKVEEYAEKISQLIDDTGHLASIGAEASLLANSLFDPVRNTLAFEELLLSIATRKRGEKKPVRIYGSRLDKPWIPNIATRWCRKFTSRLSNRTSPL